MNRDAVLNDFVIFTITFFSKSFKVISLFSYQGSLLYLSDTTHLV